MKISKLGAIVLILFTPAGLYLGLSGICQLHLEEEINKLNQKKEELSKIIINRTVNDLPPFTNKYDYEYYMQVSSYEGIFPLVKSIPIFLGLILTAMCFGLLGSIENIVLNIVKGKYAKDICIGSANKSLRRINAIVSPDIRAILTFRCPRDIRWDTRTYSD